MGTIHVSNLGKAYKQYPNRWARLVEWLLPFSKPRHKLKWILKDINFRVNSGEAVGIIGINGAGKSTLLKIISGTTQPTKGYVKITGRVSALLELGMGFHPDFTGRENVFMAGQLLNMTVDEINFLMPEIESFSGIGEYIDMPVRVYSSGMQIRLAFSIATAVRPDILIIDEALSVGDAHFQHKSFDRIRKFRELGTTLLIVSHDKQAIQTICDSAILLNAGFIEMQGQPDLVMDNYNAMLADSQNQTLRHHVVEGVGVQTISGSGEATISKVIMTDQNGTPVEVVDVGSYVELQVSVKVVKNISSLVVGYMIKDRLGQPIFGTNTAYKNMEMKDLESGNEILYSFRFSMNLGPGTYSITIALTGGETHLIQNFEWKDLALVFNVINLEHSKFDGCVWLDPELSVKRIFTNEIVTRS